MFSSKNKDTAPRPSQRPRPPVAPSGRPRALDHQRRHRGHGTLTSTGDIQVDGRVDGDVRSAGLVIGEKADQGEIYAEEVIVRGQVRAASAPARSSFVPPPCRRRHSARSLRGGSRRLFRRQLPPFRQPAGRRRWRSRAETARSGAGRQRHRALFAPLSPVTN